MLLCSCIHLSAFGVAITRLLPSAQQCPRSLTLLIGLPRTAPFTTTIILASQVGLISSSNLYETDRIDINFLNLWLPVCDCSAKHTLHRKFV